MQRQWRRQCEAAAAEGASCHGADRVSTWRRLRDARLGHEVLQHAVQRPEVGAREEVDALDLRR